MNTLCEYIAYQQDIPIYNIKSFINSKLIFSIYKSLADEIISNNCRYKTKILIQVDMLIMINTI